MGNSSPLARRTPLQLAAVLLLALGLVLATNQYLAYVENSALAGAREETTNEALAMIRLSALYADQEQLHFDEELALLRFNAKLLMLHRPALAYVYVQSPLGHRLADCVRPGLDIGRLYVEEVTVPLVRAERMLGIARFGLDQTVLRQIAALERRHVQGRLALAALGIAAALGCSWLSFRSVAGRRERREQARLREHHLAEVGELASGLAHEIRNPLGPIKMNVQLLQESLTSGADVPAAEEAEMLSTVLVEVERLEDLLAEFLAYAKPAPVELADGDLAQFTGQVVEFAAGECRRLNVELKFESTPTSRVRFDPRRLKQAFFNIILNATQAMPDGGSLDIGIRPHRDGALISFKDSGAGIAPEVLRRLFEPFFSTKKGGTGLGLSIVKRVVQAHGGEIDISSEPGSGTCVRVYLPGSA